MPKHWKHIALSFQPNGGKGSLLSDEERQTANFETFWRTLVANRKQFVFLLNDTNISYRSIYDGVLVRNAKEIRDGVKTPAPSRWAEQCWKWMKGDMPAQLSDSSFRFKVAHTAGRLGSSYIITEDSMGLGPAGAQNGDIICVLLGCSVPVLLRGSKEHEGCYYFIGKSYIHGMMDGEVMEKMKAGEYELRDFTQV